MAISNELTEMSIAVDECASGKIPKAMEKNLQKICNQFNDKLFCESHKTILRDMTTCSTKAIVHNGTQLTLHMEIRMITQVDGSIFEMIKIPFFHKNSPTDSYVLELSGKDIDNGCLVPYFLMFPVMNKSITK